MQPSKNLPDVDHNQPAEQTRATPDADLSEDSALALLQRRDVSPETLEALSKTPLAMKSRKVKVALVQHPKMPRHVSLPLLRYLFTFELMQVALSPTVVADIKKAADETLINRLETMALGEKISLARRASGRLAAELLADAEAEVIRAALENPHLMEAAVVKAILTRDASADLTYAVCLHSKWSLRKEVRIALLRNEYTPVSRAVEYARSLPISVVKEVLQISDLPEDVKAVLLRETQHATEEKSE